MAGASDPEIQELVTPAYFSISTDDKTLADTYIELLVRIDSTRFAGDPVYDQYWMNITYIIGCFPTFPDFAA